MPYHQRICRAVDTSVAGGEQGLTEVSHLALTMPLMLLTNRGKPRDTGDAWAFYREARGRFDAWDHVVLTFATDPQRQPRLLGADFVPKLVRFVDRRGDALDLYGINFGYKRGAPTDLAKTLVQEGFDETDVEAAVLNRSEAELYPQTLRRSARRALQ